MSAVLLLGGFASLPGDLEFWDRPKKKPVALPVKDSHSPKSFQWTPDSRHFVTATTRPRRVDNGFKVWSYAGELEYTEKHEELWQVLVCPTPSEVYPDRPQSPRLSDKRVAPAKAAAAAAAAPKAYVPPHRRAAEGAVPDVIKLHKPVTGPRSLVSLERTVASTGTSDPSGPYVPGAQFIVEKVTPAMPTPRAAVATCELSVRLVLCADEQSVER